MPPKRTSLTEDPPSASSSSEEHSDEESEPEGSEAEEEEEEESEEEPIQPSLKVPIVKSNPLPKQSSDDDDDEEEKTDLAADDDDEEDSESGSDSDNEPVKHMIAPRNAPALDVKSVSSDVKPISSKPMVDGIKPKKSIQPTPVAAKRPLEESSKEVEKKDKRRKKKNVNDIEEKEEDEKKSVEDTKKQFQRVWSFADEIHLLNGLRDFKNKGRNVLDMTGFFEFIKDSLCGNFNKPQTHSKVSRMQKWFNNLVAKAKDGEVPVISVPHDRNKYHIAKEIWGDLVSKDNGVKAGTDSSTADGKKRNNIASSNGAPSPKQKVLQLPINSPEVEQEIEAEENGTGFEYLYLNQSLQCPNYPALPVPHQGLTHCIAKKGWDLIGTSNAESFDQKWKAVLIAETKAYLARIDVVRDQTKLMLDALESSDV
ncbi:hypothetical protein ACHQM5_020170 [Ranunculus cassubicifolius]